MGLTRNQVSYASGSEGSNPSFSARTISYRATHLPQASGATDRDVSYYKMTPVRSHFVMNALRVPTSTFS